MNNLNFFALICFIFAFVLSIKGWTDVKKRKNSFKVDVKTATTDWNQNFTTTENVPHFILPTAYIEFKGQDNPEISFYQNNEVIITIKKDGTFWAKGMEQIKESPELYNLILKFIKIEGQQNENY